MNNILPDMFRDWWRPFIRFKLVNVRHSCSTYMTMVVANKDHDMTNQPEHISDIVAPQRKYAVDTDFNDRRLSVSQSRSLCSSSVSQRMAVAVRSKVFQ